MTWLFYLLLTLAPLDLRERRTVQAVVFGIEFLPATGLVGELVRELANLIGKPREWLTK